MFITVILKPQSFLHRIRAHSDLFCLVAKIDKMGYDKCRNPTAESGIALIPLFESLVFEGKSVWSALFSTPTAKVCNMKCSSEHRLTNSALKFAVSCPAAECLF